MTQTTKWRRISVDLKDTLRNICFCFSSKDFFKVDLNCMVLKLFKNTLS